MSTPVVLAADVREGWARTLSRHYRLDPQRGESVQRSEDRKVDGAMAERDAMTQSQLSEAIKGVDEKLAQLTQRLADVKADRAST